MSLQSNILDYLKTIPYLWCMKVIQANKNGVPDIHICWEGKYVAIESKDGKDTVKPLQEAQMKLIRKAKGRTYVARSLNDVKKIFRKKGRGYHVKENE